jgi:nucleotide-binding universal stress UspA family protein
MSVEKSARKERQVDAMNTILVPIDGSEASNHLLDLAKAMAERFSRRLLLLCVMESKAASDPAERLGGGWLPFTATMSGVALATVPIAEEQADKDRAAEHAKAVLESGQARCASLGDRVETLALEGDPARTIVACANEDVSIDLVLMRAQPTGHEKGEGLGSVAQRVALGLRKSVWFVR